MRFVVYRTSDRFNPDAPQPCEGAIDGGVVAQRTGLHKMARVWYVEIETLDALICLDSEVVVYCPAEGEVPELEIVDGYRE